MMQQYLSSLWLVLDMQIPLHIQSKNFSNNTQVHQAKSPLVWMGAACWTYTCQAAWRILGNQIVLEDYTEVENRHTEFHSLK